MLAHKRLSEHHRSAPPPILMAGIGDSLLCGPDMGPGPWYSFNSFLPAMESRGGRDTYAHKTLSGRVAKKSGERQATKTEGVWGERSYE